MEITVGTEIELVRDGISVVTPLPDGTEVAFKLKLGDFPELRPAVGAFMLAVAAETRLSATGHVCSRCGVCCRREQIAVTAQDVFQMARHLGYASDEAWRQEYMEPSPTWNPGDGLLRHQADGSCVFLESEPGGSTTRCRIYESRPQSCRDFLPTHPACIKDPGKLIQHLQQVVVRADAIEVTNDREQVTRLTSHEEALQPALETLREALRTVEGGGESRFARTLRSARETMEWMEGRFLSQSQVSVQESLRSLRQSLTALQDLCSLRQEDHPIIQELWPRLIRMEDIAAGRAPSSPLPVPDEIPEDSPLPERIYSIVFNPQGLLIQTSQGPTAAPWDQAPHLLSLARTCLQALVTADNEELKAALAEEDPPCFLCGECCRVYSVEIHPYDIERMANNLGMPEPEVIEKYTVEPRFSWNAGSRILKKRENPDGTRECVFLERRDDGFYYCGIHEFKPDVCRAYTPRNALCRKVNQVRYWPRMVAGLAWVLVTRQMVLVAPTRHLAAGRPPLSYPLTISTAFTEALRNLADTLAGRA